MERYAEEMGIPFTVDGVNEARINPSSERSIYRGLGIAFIEPELREGREGILAAQNGRLPKLIQPSDLKGDLHLHTTASDGIHSLMEMAEAARRHGYEYIAITDHSQSLRIAHGLSESRLLEHLAEIDELNGQLTDLTILKLAEVDILDDGRLDYPDDILDRLDLAICSIH